jgi:protein-disulfide isomerase
VAATAVRASAPVRRAAVRGQPYGPPPARDRRGLVVGLVAGFVPVCKEFHRVNDGTLKTLAGDGKAEVVYHPIVIFSQEPLAGNSTRASAAAHRVTGGAEWLSFQDELFLHQPPEGSSGFDAEDLVSYGSAAGVRGAGFASCVRTQRYAAQVRQASATAIAAGIVGTPTVKVNGTALPTNETLTAEALRNAVIAAG